MLSYTRKSLLDLYPEVLGYPNVVRGERCIIHRNQLVISRHRVDCDALFRKGYFLAYDLGISYPPDGKGKVSYLTGYRISIYGIVTLDSLLGASLLFSDDVLEQMEAEWFTGYGYGKRIWI